MDGGPAIIPFRLLGLFCEVHLVFSMGYVNTTLVSRLRQIE